MPISIMRFNFVLPGIDPTTLSGMYQQAIEMAAVADANGFMAVSLEEHHGVDDGWSPAPLTAAGLILGRTKNVRVMVQALLVPLNDPIRVAEQVAVLDLASGGRINVVAGLGYRPEEYTDAGLDWKTRGALLDECLDAIIGAWSGEEFSYRGRKLRVTPIPMTDASGILFIGGSGKPAARRAARLGLPFLPAAHLPELEAYYNEQCAEQGTAPFIIMPPEKTSLTLLAEDPDKAWAELGGHLLHEASRYQSWQTADIHSAVSSHASTVEELRAEGIYRIFSPDEAIAWCKAEGEWATMVLHPLCGGVPVERGWDTVNLYVDKVLPALAG
ncbi:MAG TPA: LLM class flavin-dependent oxidoreductase [Mycobacteriales bacterium]|jgi:alkanesulfonate monooxygenase SsuD/methylene tetrahydromethanopterin reductase-like flavin-dependent oxidoreductase (luciferase family)|nr:LLM class flavin-dependent oxidoreductase [Mycobacteriales bacterium]